MSNNVSQREARAEGADRHRPDARPDPSAEEPARFPAADGSGTWAAVPCDLLGPAPRSSVPGRWAVSIAPLLRTAATLSLMVLAGFAAMMVWSYYVTAPWTRDGRVRVQVANVAPQVAGQIVEIHVVDNQYVHKGDLLYVIDPFDFQVSLDIAKANLQTEAADLQVKRTEAERRQALTNLATTPEQQQQYAGAAVQAHAAFEAAQARLSQAEIDLKRTEVRSPVNGYVTNLLMRVGDYAHEGTADVSIIDADSYWITGYFEETKLARICVGDRAEARLLGFSQPVLGRVQSVTRGISVSDATPSTQGLPNVDAVYTWVRLAQRVPVRVGITDVPPGVTLVSGMTATVIVRGAGSENDRSWPAVLSRAWSGVTAFLYPPQPTPGCVPVMTEQDRSITTLPTPQPTPPRSPGEINPGLTPGLSSSPRRR